MGREKNNETFNTIKESFMNDEFHIGYKYQMKLYWRILGGTSWADLGQAHGYSWSWFEFEHEVLNF